MTKKEIIMLGPQGSGKGTQAVFLSEYFKIPHLSTGQILRDISSEKENPLAEKIIDYMNQGALVPDELVDKLIEHRIKQVDCVKGYILDGYPRNIDQVKFLDRIAKINLVLLIDINDKEAVARIENRRVCKNGHNYHLLFAPPKKEGICDACGEKLYQRDDDNKEAIEKRLKIYHQKINPIIDFYTQAKVLVKINGQQPIKKVFEEIKQKLPSDL